MLDRSNARLGRVSANSVIAIAGLIEQQMIGVYGNADGTVTETLNRFKDAVIAAQAWAAANPGGSKPRKCASELSRFGNVCEGEHYI